MSPRTETRTGGRPATTGIIPGRWALSVGRPNLPTPSGFEWTAIADVARLESGHTPSRRVPEYWSGDIPWIGIRDATTHHGRVLTQTSESVSAEGIANSSARVLPADTVCLSRTASVGFVVMMGKPMATSQDFVNWVCGPDLVPRYLFYVLIAEQESIRRFAHGTTHQTMYYPEAKALHVMLPSVSEQQAIAEVLGALDDKIEANTRISRISWDLARAAFDFAMSGNSTPVQVGQLLDLKYGKSLPASRRRTGSVPVYGSGGIVGGHDSALVRGPGVVVGRKGSAGQVHWSHGDFFPIDTTFFVAAKPGVPLLLTHFVLSELQLGQMNFDSAVPGLNREAALARSTRLPESSALSRFVDMAGPAIALDERATRESQVLQQLRDTLLPKLISGDLSVRDADSFVEAAL